MTTDQTPLTYAEAAQQMAEMGISVNRTRAILAKTRQTPNNGWVVITTQYRIRVSYQDATKYIIGR